VTLLANTVHAVTEDFKRLGADIMDLREELTKQEQVRNNQVGNLTNKTQQIDARIERHKKRLAEVEEHIPRLDGDIGTLEASIETAKKQLSGQTDKAANELKEAVETTRAHMAAALGPVHRYVEQAVADGVARAKHDAHWRIETTLGTRPESVTTAALADMVAGIEEACDAVDEVKTDSVELSKLRRDLSDLRASLEKGERLRLKRAAHLARAVLDLEKKAAEVQGEGDGIKANAEGVPALMALVREVAEKTGECGGNGAVNWAEVWPTVESELLDALDPVFLDAYERPPKLPPELRGKVADILAKRMRIEPMSIRLRETSLNTEQHESKGSEPTQDPNVPRQAILRVEHSGFLRFGASGPGAVIRKAVVITKSS